MATTLNKLKHAYTVALSANAQLLLAWRANLTPERRAELAEIERLGLRLGLQLLIPAEAWIFTIVWLDSAGGTMAFETIEARGETMIRNPAHVAYGNATSA